MALSPAERLYWATHPIEWITGFLSARLWSKQEEICDAVLHYPATSVRSGHGVGKSFIAACIILWYLFTHPNAKVITTAPTFWQVRNILWVEVSKLHKELREFIEPAGHLTQVRLELAEGWYAVGRSTDDPNSFIGTHEKNLLVVFDEACGIPRAIFDASEGLLTAKGNKQLMIGNPTEPGTYFHETHNGDVPGFHKIRINVLDSPNIKRVNGKWVDNLLPDGELPFPELTNLAWVEKMRRRHGEKSATWSAKVLGEFPTIATDALIDGRWLSAAVQKGIYLRKTVDRLDEGSEVLDSRIIRQLTGRSI
jgi:hypothetical protein